MAPRPTAARLDTELVRRGLARSRTRAAELVAQGRVSVGGAVAVRASRPVQESEVVAVDVEPGTEYVSRAAHKLVGALDALDALTGEPPVVVARRCLDAGASTGGFTQVLLERGAAHVVAVDVGRGQMAPAIADDPRVSVHEELNVRDLVPGRLGEAPGLVVADLSFISLTLVLAPLLAVAAPAADLLVMVKPQFEVGRERLGSGGVVTSVQLREESVLRVASAALALGAEVRAVAPSGLPGETGNREYFLWLVAPGEAGAATDERGRPEPEEAEPKGAELGEAVRRAVRDAVPMLVRRERATDRPGTNGASA
jgi:23S rRNA (cytidine1920-2'-O)/16S rRNA (cytidine1409-2'-O)-methyltransferase